MSIRNKIIFSYILLIFISFVIIGTLFNIMIRDFLINDARQNLIRQGTVIQKIYNRKIRTTDELGRIKYKPKFRLGDKILDGDMIVVNRYGDIIYSSKENPLGGNKIDYAILGKIMAEGSYNSIKIGNFDAVAAVFPIKSAENGNVIGAIVLYTLVKGIKVASLRIFSVLLKGFLVSGIISLIIGYFLSRSITLPIKKLITMVKRIKNKKFGEKVDVIGEGELKVLAEAFNDMSIELDNYYTSQNRFLQNASHELKSPLMSIQGYAEGIKDGVIESSDISKSLDIIIDESIRLRDIVNELMYLSKLETRQEKLSISRENIKDIIEECIEKISPIIYKNGLKLNSDLKDVSIKCDRKRIFQAFTNILSNATRYAKTTISIEIMENKDNVIIDFENDGRKFTDEELKNMFQRFYKGEKGETGLGLAITKAIIESHGGKILPFNTENGVCFEITIKK